MLVAADLPPLEGEQKKPLLELSMCPFQGGVCRGHKCALFMVRKYTILEGAKRPWCGCAVRAIPLVLKGEL